MTDQERTRREALLRLRREARRWVATAGRDVTADDVVAAHRVERALQRYRAAAA